MIGAIAYVLIAIIVARLAQHREFAKHKREFGYGYVSGDYLAGCNMFGLFWILTIPAWLLFRLIGGVRPFKHIDKALQWIGSRIP